MSLNSHPSWPERIRQDTEAVKQSSSGRSHRYNIATAAMQERYPCFMFDGVGGILHNKLFYPYVIGRNLEGSRSKWPPPEPLEGPLRIMWTLSDDGLYADKLALLHRALTETCNPLVGGSMSAITWEVRDAMTGLPGLEARLRARARGFGREVWARLQPHLQQQQQQQTGPTLQQHRLVNALLMHLSFQGGAEENPSVTFLRLAGHEPLDLQAWADERFRQHTTRAHGGLAADVLSDAEDRHRAALRQLQQMKEVNKKLKETYKKRKRVHDKGEDKGDDKDDDEDDAQASAAHKAGKCHGQMRTKLEAARGRLWFTDDDLQTLGSQPRALRDKFETNIERDMRDVAGLLGSGSNGRSIEDRVRNQEKIKKDSENHVKYVGTNALVRERLPRGVYAHDQETWRLVARYLHARRYPRSLLTRLGRIDDDSFLVEYAHTLLHYLNELIQGPRHESVQVQRDLSAGQRLLWGESADELYAPKRAALMDGLPLYVAVELFQPAWSGIVLPVAQVLGVDLSPLLKDAARAFGRQDVVERLRVPADDGAHLRANALLRLVLGDARRYRGFMWRGRDVFGTSVALWKRTLPSGSRAQDAGPAGGHRPIPADVFGAHVAGALLSASKRDRQLSLRRHWDAAKRIDRKTSRRPQQQQGDSDDDNSDA